MYANAQVLLDNRPTAGAHLRGVGGVHGHDHGTGTLCLVLKQLLELSQPRIVCAQGQVVTGGHKLEREVFRSDQAVGIHLLTGYLVPEIAALVGDVLVQAGVLFGSLATAMTPLLAAGHAALCYAQFHQRPTQPAASAG